MYTNTYNIYTQKSNIYTTIPFSKKKCKANCHCVFLTFDIILISPIMNITFAKWYHCSHTFLHLQYFVKKIMQKVLLQFTDLSI